MAKKNTKTTDSMLPPEDPADWTVEDMLTQARIEAARIPERFRLKTFETFKINRDKNRSKVLQMARDYVDAFNFNDHPPEGLILKGEVGSGKTHIALAILQAIVRKGYSGLFYNMPDLLMAIRETYEQHSSTTEHELLDTLAAPDLLLLDDLGAEKPAEWVTDRLYLIVNRRYEQNKPLLITTNNDMTELARKLNDRIVSRLCEITIYCDNFPNKDYRKEHMH